MKVHPVNIKAFASANLIIIFNVSVDRIIQANFANIQVRGERERHADAICLSSPSSFSTDLFQRHVSTEVFERRRLSGETNISATRNAFFVFLLFASQIVEPKGEQCICKSSFTGSLCELRKGNCSNNGKNHRSSRLFFVNGRQTRLFSVVIHR